MTAASPSSKTVVSATYHFFMTSGFEVVIPGPTRATLEEVKRDLRRQLHEDSFGGIVDVTDGDGRPHLLVVAAIAHVHIDYVEDVETDET